MEHHFDCPKKERFDRVCSCGLDVLHRDAARYRAWRKDMVDADCARDGEAASTNAVYDNMVDGIIERQRNARRAIDAAKNK